MSAARRALRRALRGALAATLVLIAILVVNAMLARPRPREALPPAPPAVVKGDVIAAHLGAAIRIDTVSHEDPAKDDRDKRRALRELLQSSYPRLHARAKPEVIDDCGLLFTWQGADPSLPPALFAAHMDVVPIEPGTEGKWDHPPFSGAIDGGFVHGRGALDDKAQMIEILEAAESLLVEGFSPRRTLLIGLGCDEEIGGAHGAKAIAAALAKRGARLSFVIDEGMAVTDGIVPDVDRRVALIGVGEKGYVTIELSVEMPGGHSSMPPRETAVSVIAAAVDRVARSPMPARLEGVPREQLTRLAPFMPFGKRLATANLWLLSPVVRGMLEKKPVTNAMVRTTTAPTIVEGGVQENVLPSKARAVVNHRILPGDTMASVLDHVRRAVADPRVKLRQMGALDGDPPPISSTTSRAYRILETTIERFYPDAVVVPSLVLGATDGRHYASIADGVYRFAPFVLKGARERESIHGTNERVRVDDLQIGVGVFRELMRDGSGP
jgi:carboxypeptidase PM20D1